MSPPCYSSRLRPERDLALDFRWELYHAFNTPTLANPASTYAANGPGNAGRITSTIGGPRTMQAGVRLQFQIKRG